MPDLMRIRELERRVASLENLGVIAIHLLNKMSTLTPKVMSGEITAEQAKEESSHPSQEELDAARKELFLLGDTPL